MVRLSVPRYEINSDKVAQTAVNRLRKSKYRSAVKKMEVLVKKGDKEKIKSFFPKFPPS